MTMPTRALFKSAAGIQMGLDLPPNDGRRGGCSTREPGVHHSASPGTNADRHGSSPAGAARRKLMPADDATC